MTIVEFLTARLDEREENVRIALRTEEEHVSQFDLDDIATKRAIVDIHEGLHSCGFLDYDNDDPCGTLRQLASVYADHPDYREEWGI